MYVFRRCVMNIRKLGYNFISKITSNPVNAFIEEFKLNDEEKTVLALKRLHNILEIAKNHTKFYANFTSFESFPIISKSILRERYDDFLSNKMNIKDSVIATTSGSSGQPMTFYLSKYKKLRQNAEVIFYNRWANIDIGDCHAYVRVTDSKSKLKLFLQNQVLMNPKHLTDDWLNKQIDFLHRKRIVGIIGHPSAIAAIAQKAREQGFTQHDFSLKGIVTTGETLKDQDREIMKVAFGVNPISRYSTEEFGVLAASCPQCGMFHCNDTGYIIEILKLDEDKPVNIGEPGRVVVTDLFSDHLPLIRFDTGDIAVYGGNSKCSFYPTGIVLESVLGRQIETVYDIKGNPISPFAINGALRDFNSIKQFQFIQNALDQNILLLVIHHNFGEDDINTIKFRFSNLLGNEPEIKIVDEIPALRSGKRPYIINNYKKNLPET